MKPDIVVDIGNSRVKWGRCLGEVLSEVAYLLPDSADWNNAAEAWRLTPGTRWVVSGVHPDRRRSLVEWITDRGDHPVILESPRQLPIRVDLEEPDHVGIDRLLDAVAARSRCSAGTPAVIIGAGTAVTVNYVNESGAYVGGAIFPGIRLMARVLNEHTALLPFVAVEVGPQSMPAKSTPEAIRAGILGAVVGGVEKLVQELQSCSARPAPVFLSGGDGALIRPLLGFQVQLWPEMTLEGIRLSAAHLEDE
jgi:type III pantothenate kinase